MLVIRTYICTNVGHKGEGCFLVVGVTLAEKGGSVLTKLTLTLDGSGCFTRQRERERDRAQRGERGP